jgi:hypothetical protein
VVPEFPEDLVSEFSEPARADSAPSHQVVQVFNKDGMTLVATTQTIPIKRMDARGDLVVKLNPTTRGHRLP